RARRSDGRAEGVALARIPRLQAAAQPGHALRARPVGEAFGHRPLARRAHQRVVADRIGGRHGLLHVARFHDALAIARARARGPHAGVAVGLKLHADLERVALGLRGALLALADLV